MKLPGLLYGIRQNVERRVTKIITQLKKGKNILETINDEYIIADSQHGMILVDKLTFKNETTEFFYLHLLFDKLEKAFLTNKVKKIKYFNEFFKTDWLSLLLLNQNCLIWIRDDAKLLKKQLNRIVELWPIINSKDIKLSFGSSTPAKSIWFESNVRLLLSMFGVAREDLSKKLENNDIMPLVCKYKLID